MPATARSIRMLALAALVGGCAALAPRHVPIGSPSTAVIQAMGEPVDAHPLPEGGRRLEYGGGTYGRRTLMFDFDAADRLTGVVQVRTEAHFNAIRPGMSADEVLARIGRPSTIWSIPRQRQNVWSYRYETPFCEWFMVGMGYDGRVVDTAHGPDPACDDDGFFDRFGKRR
jgi:hypothetical protein